MSFLQWTNGKSTRDKKKNKKKKRFIVAKENIKESIRKTKKLIFLQLNTNYSSFVKQVMQKLSSNEKNTDARCRTQGIENDVSSVGDYSANLSTGMLRFYLLLARDYFCIITTTKNHVMGLMLLLTILLLT